MTNARILTSEAERTGQTKPTQTRCPTSSSFGGSGYIGLALSQSLKSSGNYFFWAPSRTDITDPKTLSNIILENDIDIRMRISLVLSGFAYCSGSWVYGFPSERVSDLSPLGRACISKDKVATTVTWRPAHEQAILAARDIIDVRHPSSSWDKNNTDTIQIPVYTTIRTGIVHVDSVAAGFHAAIDRIDGRLGGWFVFDLVAETIGIQEIIVGIKAALGLAAEVAYTGTHGDAFLEAIGLKKDLLLNLPVYVRACEAAQ
ncbi:uncharacterized protein BDW70DRAFT_151601 [Aspergillus foveolatus]|uniref:uncharacterized protein n=1 Tax=Aspergillus foveolatus TaxID=210207 RepID=UPI003CCD1899